MRHVAAMLLVATVAAACGTSGTVSGQAGGRATGPSLASAPLCQVEGASPPMVAVTSDGSLVTVDFHGLHIDATVARFVDPDGGVAVGPTLQWALVTALGPDGLPAVWKVPLAACGQRPGVVAADAELPSLSPDGTLLGFVTLDRSGQQTGVDIAPVDSAMDSTGPARHYPAPSVPPPVPIKALAVASGRADLAVWGGFVDRYLGVTQPTVGTLDPKVASSLAPLSAVFDGAGVSLLPGAAVTKDWQSAPVFLPNGELVVGMNSAGVVMPFTDSGGGGFRNIVTDAGAVSSLAAGPSGALAWVDAGGTLTVEAGAVDLPYGPGAFTAPTTPPPTDSLNGHINAIAWTAGTQAPTTPAPVFEPVAHLPNVVGISQQAATEVMKTLDLPVLVQPAPTTSGTRASVVVGQDPPAGDGVACQCTIVLRVSAPSPT